MEVELTQKDRKRIFKGIKKKYSKVAKKPEGLFKYPTGRAGLEGLNYDREIIQSLPEKTLSSYCGVGNPFTLGTLHKGEAVLDVGCGGGVDTMVAATLVGSEGKVVGIEMTPKMLKRARKNVEEASFHNISFEEASAENLPLPNSIFDVVISNGVFNLIPDKAKALREVFRVLKLGGRMMIADQILTGVLPEDTNARIGRWCR